jgi:hypothetical protein
MLSGVRGSTRIIWNCPVACVSCPATGVGRVITSGTTMTSRKREVTSVGSVIKKRRKRMAKKKHRKLLKRTRIQRRRAGK